MRDARLIAISPPSCWSGDKKTLAVFLSIFSVTNFKENVLLQVCFYEKSPQKTELRNNPELKKLSAIILRQPWLDYC